MSSETISLQRGISRAGISALILLSLGHFCVDLYSSALAALQPLLIDKLHFSLTQAGVLGGVMIFSSSVLQPVYGYLSDRYRSRLFSALAPAVAGVFISALGMAPSFGWLCAMVALGAAGVASFHPQASSRVGMSTTANRGRWMAVFISSGSMGMAVGPAYFTTLANRVGLERSIWAALPGVAVTLLLLYVLPPPAGHDSSERPRFDLGPLRAVWKPLTILYFAVFLRSIVQIGFTQFIPLYLARERGFSVTSASLTLSLYSAAGALGGFLGGYFADRFGGRQVILVSMLGSAPFLALFLMTGGVVSIASLALGGLILLFTIPVNVVMAQELVPSQAATISALMMGFAWGVAGVIFIPLTGWVADRTSLHHALLMLVVFPLLGFLLTLKLPRELRHA
ncbi:MAG: MFS transporter [Acidobacteria bacterium]|nr:MFS transporter [Acidobacteriota bacterium]